MRDLLNLAIVLGSPVLIVWLIFSRRPGGKILCLLGRHDFQIAHGHPDSKLGYCIHECTGCPKAVVSDPSLGGSYPILNTQAALERDASKAAEEMEMAARESAGNALSISEQQSVKADAAKPSPINLKIPERDALYGYLRDAPQYQLEALAELGVWMEKHYELLMAGRANGIRLGATQEVIQFMLNSVDPEVAGMVAGNLILIQNDPN